MYSVTIPEFTQQWGNRGRWVEVAPLSPGCCRTNNFRKYTATLGVKLETPEKSVQNHLDVKWRLQNYETKVRESS